MFSIEHKKTSLQIFWGVPCLTRVHLERCRIWSIECLWDEIAAMRANRIRKPKWKYFTFDIVWQRALEFSFVHVFAWSALVFSMLFCENITLSDISNHVNFFVATLSSDSSAWMPLFSNRNLCEGGCGVAVSFRWRGRRPTFGPKRKKSWCWFLCRMGKASD